MNQTLEQLIKLQEIDHRLLEIKELMGDLPSTVESQETELSILENDNKDKKQRIGEIDKESRYLEREIEDSKKATEKANRKTDGFPIPGIGPASDGGL